MHRSLHFAFLSVVLRASFYNLLMADRMVCSCVTCPQCGTWVVLASHTQIESSQAKVKTSCPAPDCHKHFEFAGDEIRAFEVPLALFERRHFYGSELHEARR
jgi:ribosomal protein S27AE